MIRSLLAQEPAVVEYQVRQTYTGVDVLLRTNGVIDRPGLRARLAGALGNLTGGSLSDILVRRAGLRNGRRFVAAAGLAASALCLFGTAVVDNRLAAVALLTLGYFSMDCMLPVSWAVCVDVGRRHAGAVTGAMNSAGQIGSFLSSIAFGALVDAFGGRYDVPLVLFSGCLLVSALLFLRIDASKPIMEEQHAT